MPRRIWSHLGDDPRILLARQLPGVSRRLTLLLIGAILVEAALPVGLMLASGRLIGAVPGTVEAGLDSPSGRRLLAALVATVVLFVAIQVVGPLRQLLVGTLSRRLDGALRARVMGAALRPSGVAHLEDPALHDLLARARGTAHGHTPAAAVTGLTEITASGLQAFGATLLIALYFRWWLALGLLAALLFARSRARQRIARAVAVLYGATPVLRRAEYFLKLALTPDAAKETRVFGLVGWVLDRFRAEWLGAMRPVWAERRTGTRTVAPWVLVAVFAALFAALGLLGRDAARGEIGLEAFAIVAQAILELTGILFSFSGADLALEYGSAALPAVFELEATTADGRVAGRRDDRTPPTGEIRFEQVAFAYPRAEADVLTALDLVIPAGRSLAIVGANGAGKTTLTKLLARLYEPSGGRILVDGVDLREVDPVDWRRRIAVIFQDFVRYELPARDNVGFGAIERLDDTAAVDRAARLAGADGVVVGLANGWDTVLSRQYRSGGELSGGQWQRIALARALFAIEAGATVLVLDEPTASLDVRAEVELFERLLDVTRGVTTILISHRVSTVRRAERICVIDGGRVAEEGTHEELLAAGGRYARMFELQASRFGADASDDAGVDDP